MEIKAKVVLPMLVLLASGRLMSQFNAQIGYQFSYSALSGFNGIIRDYNTDNPSLARKMEDLHGLHALCLGLRQGVGRVSLLAGWSNQVDRLHATGPQANSADPDFLRELFVKQEIYSLGIESLSGIVGVGGSVDWRSLKVKSRDSGSSSKNSVLTDGMPGSTLYLFYDLPVSSRLAIVLKASYAFPWRSADLSPLGGFLLDAEKPVSDSFRQWGVSLLFSNGRQPRYW